MTDHTNVKTCCVDPFAGGQWQFIFDCFHRAETCK